MFPTKVFKKLQEVQLTENLCRYVPPVSCNAHVGRFSVPCVGSVGEMSCRLMLRQGE